LQRIFLGTTSIVVAAMVIMVLDYGCKSVPASAATALAQGANNPLTPSGTDVQIADRLSQYGITWVFDRPHTVGRFVTGDWWVVGPVTVESVSPQPNSGRNGSVVNPAAGALQGYDDRMEGYSPTLAAKFPLALKAGQSLVSTSSVEKVGIRTGETQTMQYARGPLRTATVLTCVAEVPPPDAFRPAYVGETKLSFTTKQLRRDLLPGLKLPMGTKLPDLQQLERALQRIWLDHQANYVGRYMHPLENMPDYGRDITNIVSNVSLVLMLDNPKNDTLLFHFVQLGIDNYGVVESNAHIWTAGGGHDSGRKMPILFAGVLLGDIGMQHVVADFAEDLQTYYGLGYRGQKVLWRVDANEARQHEELPPEKWHGPPFKGDNDGWKSEGYRGLNGPTWVGECLAARLIGAKALWSHDPFFDYVDRWIAEAKDGMVDPQTLQTKGYIPATGFVKAMWDEYRAKADEIGADARKKSQIP
jgi:hypothetical protein